MRFDKVVEIAAVHLMNPDLVSKNKRIRILVQYAREEGIVKGEKEVAKLKLAFDVDLTKKPPKDLDRKLAQILLWYYINYLSDPRPVIADQCRP